MLTNDKHMQELNREFRDKNKPTNVLSFPDTDI
jgi:probable rRNA maturation factor